MDKEATLKIKQLELEKLAVEINNLFNKIGRIRNIVTAPDGSLFMVTDSNKGKLYRVTPNN